MCRAKFSQPSLLDLGPFILLFLRLFILLLLLALSVCASLEASIGWGRMRLRVTASDTAVRWLGSSVVGDMVTGQGCRTMLSAGWKAVNGYIKNRINK